MKENRKETNEKGVGFLTKLFYQMERSEKNGDYKGRKYVSRHQPCFSLTTTQ